MDATLPLDSLMSLHVSVCVCVWVACRLLCHTTSPLFVYSHWQRYTHSLVVLTTSACKCQKLAPALPLNNASVSTTQPSRQRHHRLINLFISLCLRVTLSLPPYLCVSVRNCFCHMLSHPESSVICENAAGQAGRLPVCLLLPLRVPRGCTDASTCRAVGKVPIERKWAISTVLAPPFHSTSVHITQGHPLLTI